MDSIYHSLHAVFRNTLLENNDPIEKLAELFRAQTFPKNSSLLLQGEAWDKVFFIEKGLVRLYFVTPDGEEYNKNFFAENTLLWPATPLTRKEESLFYIGTLEECKIHTTPYALFEKILKESGLWEKFTLPFCEKLVDQKISREYAFLMSDAKTRYLDFLQEQPDLARRLPDYHLASYLGMTNVTLSRIKKNLKN